MATQEVNSHKLVKSEKWTLQETRLYLWQSSYLRIYLNNKNWVFKECSFLIILEAFENNGENIDKLFVKDTYLDTTPRLDQ